MKNNKQPRKGKYTRLIIKEQITKTEFDRLSKILSSQLAYNAILYSLKFS